MILCLCRHAESVANVKDVIEGRRNSHLSPRGIRQARKLRSNIPFCPDVVYTSPLTRAIETAKLAFPMTEVRVVPDLIEGDAGRLEGRSLTDLTAEEHDQYQRMIDDPTFDARKVLSAEGVKEFLSRSIKVFEEIVWGAKDEGFQAIVLITHGGWINNIVARHLQLSQTRLGNCGFFLLRQVGNRWVLDYPTQKDLEGGEEKKKGRMV